MGQSVA